MASEVLFITGVISEMLSKHSQSIVFLTLRTNRFL
jgi:hypothetical protein